MVLPDGSGDYRYLDADFGPIVDATKQLEYRIKPPTNHTALKAWCRENLQCGWYIAQRPVSLGGGHILFLEDDQDFDMVVIAWGPEKKNEAR